MNRKTKLLFLVIKILISALLLAVIFRKAGLRNVLFHLQSMDLRFFFLSSLLYVLTIFISTLRWRLVLDKSYPLKKLFSLYIIGSFFNNLLPGAIGGDAVKAYYLYKDTQNAGSSIGYIFMDRFIGFFGLLSIGLISWLLAFKELRTLGMHWAIPSLFIFFILGSPLFFWLRIGARFPAVSSFYDYIHRTVRRKMVVLKAYCLSIVIQVLSILMIYIIARGMGQNLSFTALFVFVPIIMVITMIPISIAGLGVREGAFVVLFGLTGVPPEVAASISFLWFLSIATGSLVGLVEYARYKQ